MAGDFPFMFRDHGQNGIARSPEIVSEAAGAVFAERQKKKLANRVVIARGFVANDRATHDFNVINYHSSKTGRDFRKWPLAAVIPRSGRYGSLSQVLRTKLA